VQVIVLEAGASFLRYNVVGGHTLLFGRGPYRRAATLLRRGACGRECHARTARPGVRAAEATREVSEETAKRNSFSRCGLHVYSTLSAFRDVWYEGWLCTEAQIDNEWILQPGTFLAVCRACEKKGEYLNAVCRPGSEHRDGLRAVDEHDRRN